MTWEEKLLALKGITDTCLRMRTPGDWYVSASCRSIGGDGLLRGAYGNGKTPEEAVEDDWRLIVDELPAGSYVQVNEYKYRWNGYLWESVK